MHALRACPAGSLPLVSAEHFEAAFDHVFPSVSKQDEQQYLQTANKLRMARAKNSGGGSKGSKAAVAAGGAGAAPPDGTGHAST